MKMAKQRQFNTLNIIVQSFVFIIFYVRRFPQRQRQREIDKRTQLRLAFHPEWKRRKIFNFFSLLSNIFCPSLSRNIQQQHARSTNTHKACWTRVSAAACCGWGLTDKCWKKEKKTSLFFAAFPLGILKVMEDCTYIHWHIVRIYTYITSVNNETNTNKNRYVINDNSFQTISC